MAKKEINLKQDMEINREIAETKAKRVLEKIDAFEMNKHRQDRKGVPPVARNDLGIGRK
ncbi:hypothetical protein [Orenia marismortui]|uniref:Uncharacterized protein n=1 Tax=Orenia marismortui TaxID=46469 RepID=A0A4V3GXR7_9FIRM|nr:hypothetical protein [Orenia marismortui]TDX49209.1 hypothetical protein C7959_11930 [Orenia marismortui]